MTHFPVEICGKVKLLPIKHKLMTIIIIIPVKGELSQHFVTQYVCFVFR